MSRVFYHSDWHLNHEFVASTRGFDSAEEHDEWLIEGINSVVTKRDHLWVLGDLTIGNLGTALEKVKRINGIKHLVFGNHDTGHPMYKKSHSQQKRYFDAFESVHVHEQHLINGQRVLLSHFPYTGDHADREDRYTQWRLRNEGLPLICGHVHDKWIMAGQQLNVGVDHFAKPITADAVEMMFRINAS